MLNREFIQLLKRVARQSRCLKSCVRRGAVCSGTRHYAAREASAEVSLLTVLTHFQIRLSLVLAQSQMVHVFYFAGSARKLRLRPPKKLRDDEGSCAIYFLVMNRTDGRASDQLRPVIFELGIAPYAGGSVLVTMGNTRI